MISDYITLLYSNCKLLHQKNGFDENKLRVFFEGQIKNSLLNQGLSSEQKMLELLLAKPYAQLSDLFSASKFLHIFYLINSFNEYNASEDSYDNLGRFKFEHSVPGKSGITNNTVLTLIKETVKEDGYLGSVFEMRDHKSYFYLSHDIDSVYGSMTQDGLWAIKKGRIDVLLQLFFNAVIAKPHWLNFDLIMKTESEYDFKSTFYWLVNQGKIDTRQSNSDYSINSGRIVKEIHSVSENGFENGLHKSISNENFPSELSKLPVNVTGNRYHYLKFQLPGAYHQIEEAGLQLDASLGFAEHYGFRNGYGYPFHPFNTETNKPYSFVEVPLNIMDGTFQRYMQVPVEKTADTIIAFLEAHQHNALLSVLWHNTFFSDYKYKGYLNEYKKILAYLHETKFQNINQNEIIEQFSWQIK